ncbi:hypothetical protein B0I35DRAFT_503838 [Stachybotrys elegans]|uniref:FAD-binding PCMH-type domain-containing protein n=1 Tax=Stachybotrys elegans TaxID=80388 RepID=A0A8K0SKE3_9HYPO|nr:hypothetical protein B0I35DRAFT_503838 [Stachybotrys elegans]
MPRGSCDPPTSKRAQNRQAVKKGIRSRSSPKLNCRCFPGDTCWPKDGDWNRLNATLGGRLIKTVPIASICHDTPWSAYDAETCAALQSEWELPATHYESPSSPMAPFASNMSCDPFSPRQTPCTLGNYASYSINASSTEHFRVALSFVRQHNLRLVVKNTGHDYMWKSTGAGSLSLWTHNMRDTSVIDYEAPHYRSKALRVSAGVMNSEAQAAAHEHGLFIIGGNCPTVGIAGGYTQGGGHGNLASAYGLAADQVLEWEVMTANGDLLRATPTLNSDLYWALAGGGGGTFGIVASVTVKAYETMPFAAARLSFAPQQSTTDAFYEAVHKLITTTPRATAAGVAGTWLLTHNIFYMDRMVAPNMTSDELVGFLSPTVEYVKDRNISLIEYTTNTYPSYYATQQALGEINFTQYHIGSHFVPSHLVQDVSDTSVIDTLRFVAEAGGAIAGVFLDASKPPSVPNSAHPSWREAALLLVYALPYDRYDYDANVQAQKQITELFGPKFEELAPGAGSYLNEADLYQPNWQHAFYGSNYKKLLRIKKKYDPDNILFARMGVGSEEWEIQPDGRLCKL